MGLANYKSVYYQKDMYKLIWSLGLFTLLPLLLKAQNAVEFIVKDSVTSELLVGVNIILEKTTSVTVTNDKGLAKLNNIPDGEQTITCSFVGYEKKSLLFRFPVKKEAIQPFSVFLSPDLEEMEEVTVTATRNNSRIEDLPSRIEVLGKDDMQEENGIRPSNITSLLGDIAGIQMQQTSTASGNVNARIQGLNGRYSQMLKDGMPLYGGFSGSFSILQIPPLDLRQIEIIKGSASTLYGGDAIGGIINLVSKEPSRKSETSFLINQTSLMETDFNTYLSRKYNKVGFTLYAGYTTQKPVDVNKDGFSDVPNLSNLLIHPRFYIYVNKNTTLSVGLTSTIEERKGGDMIVMEHGANAEHQYFVLHQSHRNAVEIHFEKKNNDGSVLSFKGSTSILNREIKTSQYIFKANQDLYYSELSYFHKREKYNAVFGLNFTGDYFLKTLADSIRIPNYNYSTLGLFAQNDLHITEKILLQSGLRYDYHSYRKGFILPQLSVMYKYTPLLTARLNGGFGYKVPVAFSYINEETDLNRIVTAQSNLKVETSKGVNFDINYNVLVANSINIILNQSFFYTLLDKPVVYRLNNNNQVELSNGNKPIETEGIQSYARISYSSFELYMSYVYTHAIKKYDSQSPWFLATPRHNFSSTFTFEPGKNWRMGLEGTFVGSQYVENNEKTPSYMFMAAMIQRKWKRIAVVLNCENVLDYRQKNYVSLPIIDPTFKTLWAPIDGRVINLSANFKL